MAKVAGFAQPWPGAPLLAEASAAKGNMTGKLKLRATIRAKLRIMALGKPARNFEVVQFDRDGHVCIPKIRTQVDDSGAPARFPK
jgi:hypothetical protein